MTARIIIICWSHFRPGIYKKNNKEIILLKKKKSSNSFENWVSSWLKQLQHKLPFDLPLQPTTGRRLWNAPKHSCQEPANHSGAKGFITWGISSGNHHLKKKWYAVKMYWSSLEVTTTWDTCLSFITSVFNIMSDHNISETQLTRVWNTRHFLSISTCFCIT